MKERQLTHGQESPRQSVSVIIPTRDRGPLLAGTLRSVLAQTHDLVEVVVVDDASAPPSTVPDDPRVRVLRNGQSRGVAAARNRGVEAATGRWVAFVDDDDLWHPRKLADQLAAIESTPGARWCCTGAVVVDSDLAVVRPQWAPEPGDQAGILLRTNRIPGGASGVLVERALLDQVGRFDDELSLLADWDLWIRLSLVSPLAVAPQPHVAYRTHGGAMSSAVDRARTEAERVREKYAAARVERGIDFSDASRERYYAEVHQRRGRRVAGARSHLHLARRHKRTTAYAWAGLALLWPGSIRLRDRKYRAAATPDWLSHAECWLSDVRRAGVTTRHQGPRPVTTGATEVSSAPPPG